VNAIIAIFLPWLVIITLVGMPLIFFFVYQRLRSRRAA
jgi:pilus assembly protein TadC